VSSRPNIQPEGEDPVDEDTEDEGRSDREEEILTLQRHPTGDPDEARMEGEGEG
jgi:hypothetical protein